MTPKPKPDATDAELAVLRVLWERGPATIRDLTEQLYPGGRNSGYATVQKLLERLEGKGFARRDRNEVPHVFAAAIERDDLIAQRLAAVADSLCEGSLTPLLNHLVEQRSLSEADRRALRQLVDSLDQAPPAGDRS